MKNLILTVAVASFIVSCKCEKGTPASAYTKPEVTAESSIAKTEKPAGESVDADGNYIYDLGENVDLKLPDGTVLKVGNKSLEYVLFNQLNSPDFKVNEDKTKDWLHFDRVYFPKGKSAVSATSEEQIKNVAAILKAFPKAVVKIGGYTDTTGSKDVNMKISTDRAKTVSDAIVALGEASANISSEGYGPEHFVCEANDTPECQAQNRRVDIRVTSK